MGNSENDNFELELNGVRMEVERLKVRGGDVFRVVFSSNRKPIVVTKTFNNSGMEFWTSIPEGRQREAEGVGKLIDKYLNSKKV